MSNEDRHITILLVEDDTDHAELIRRSFRGDPDRFSFQTATSIAEAETALATTTPSIVITDWRLPDGDGLSLLQNLLKQPRIPVLIISSYWDNRLERAACEAGAAGVLEKSEATFLEMHHEVEKVIEAWSRNQ